MVGTGSGTCKVRPDTTRQRGLFFPKHFLQKLGLKQRGPHQGAEQRACGLCRGQDLRSVERPEGMGMKVGMEKQALS